ncbi:7775_t:CDS:1, partial [Acaulospora morrowiae]
LKNIVEESPELPQGHLLDTKSNLNQESILSSIKINEKSQSNNEIILKGVTNESSELPQELPSETGTNFYRDSDLSVQIQEENRLNNELVLKNVMEESSELAKGQFLEALSNIHKELDPIPMQIQEEGQLNVKMALRDITEDSPEIQEHLSETGITEDSSEIQENLLETEINLPQKLDHPLIQIQEEGHFSDKVDLTYVEETSELSQEHSVAKINLNQQQDISLSQVHEENNLDDYKITVSTDAIEESVEKSTELPQEHTSEIETNLIQELDLPLAQAQKIHSNHEKTKPLLTNTMERPEEKSSSSSEKHISKIKTESDQKLDPLFIQLQESQINDDKIITVLSSAMEESKEKLAELPKENILKPDANLYQNLDLPFTQIQGEIQPNDIKKEKMLVDVIKESYELVLPEIEINLSQELTLPSIEDQLENDEREIVFNNIMGKSADLVNIPLEKNANLPPIQLEEDRLNNIVFESEVIPTDVKELNEDFTKSREENLLENEIQKLNISSIPNYEDHISKDASKECASNEEKSDGLVEAVETNLNQKSDPVMVSVKEIQLDVDDTEKMSVLTIIEPKSELTDLQKNSIV